MWIEECYKTLLSNLADPIALFTTDFFPWECSESTTEDVSFYADDLWDSDDATYFTGATPDPDTHAVGASYCTGGVFASKTNASYFDIALNLMQTFGKAKPGMKKPRTFERTMGDYSQAQPVNHKKEGKVVGKK
jgi:hypothetical protein